jgi:regulator of protease activity HflC (stomatin/prohibitin superfamily)
MSKTIAIIIGLVLLVSLLLFSMTYTVNFHEVAIKTRFGKTDENSIVRDAGLKFRLPLFADKVTTLDTRLQIRESVLDSIQTSDGQQVVVRAFLMWKVSTQGNGPLNFLNSFSSLDEANNALNDQFGTAVRAGVSRYRFNELLGSQSRLAEAEQAMKQELGNLIAKGIEPVSVGISQMVLPPKTTQGVIQRMQATRLVISENERSKGNAEAASIENTAKRQAEKIRAFARQRAAQIQSTGDKDAAIYMAQMGSDEGLAVFLTWLSALESTLSTQTTLVLPTAFAPFHLLQLNTPTDGRGIPQPSSAPSMQLKTMSEGEIVKPAGSSVSGEVPGKAMAKEGS